MVGSYSLAEAFLRLGIPVMRDAESLGTVIPDFSKECLGDEGNNSLCNGGDHVFIYTWSRPKFPLIPNYVTAKISNTRVLLTKRSVTKFSTYFYLLTLWRRNYFFLISAHLVYKMWIIQERNKLALWNKLHFEEKRNGEYRACLKYSVPNLLNKYIKCNVWRLAVRYDPYVGRQASKG